MFTIAPASGYPDPKHPYVLDTDATDVGMEVMLSQVRDGEESVIAYFSKIGRSYWQSLKRLNISDPTAMVDSSR